MIVPNCGSLFIMENQHFTIKICGILTPQRYVVERFVRAALEMFKEKNPKVEEEIYAINNLNDILKNTQVLILPSLVVNEKVVCVG